MLQTTKTETSGNHKWKDYRKSSLLKPLIARYLCTFDKLMVGKPLRLRMFMTSHKKVLNKEGTQKMRSCLSFPCFSLLLLSCSLLTSLLLLVVLTLCICQCLPIYGTWELEDPLGITCSKLVNEYKDPETWRCFPRVTKSSWGWILSPGILTQSSAAIQVTDLYNGKMTFGNKQNQEDILSLHFN